MLQFHNTTQSLVRKMTQKKFDKLTEEEQDEWQDIIAARLVHEVEHDDDYEDEDKHLDRARFLLERK